MDIVDFQEKMDPAHREYFCRMLQVKELPEVLLEQYARVKMLVDRIDAPVPVGNLAMIIMMAGFNQCIGKFPVEKDTPVEQPVKEMVEQPVDEAIDEVVKEAWEPSETDEGKPDLREEKILPSPDTVVDKQGKVVGATGQAQEQPAAQPVGSGKLWSPGMPVTVLHEEDLKEGRIASVHPPEEGSGEAVQLTVEFEGGITVTVDEDEVEAI